MISAVALPAIGIHPFPTMFLRLLHLVSADVLLIVAGLHLGLNWKWVVNALRKSLGAPLVRGAGRVALVIAAIGARWFAKPQ